jgi:hypothetical protein
MRLVVCGKVSRSMHRETLLASAQVSQHAYYPGKFCTGATSAQHCRLKLGLGI